MTCGTVAIRCASVIILLACTSALAEDAKAPEPVPALPADSVIAFVAAHPECVEITDACMVCRIEDGRPLCSNTAIACVKTALTCSRRKPSP